MFRPEYGWFLLKLTITGKLPQKLPRCFSDVNQMGPDKSGYRTSPFWPKSTCTITALIETYSLSKPGRSDYWLCSLHARNAGSVNHVYRNG